MKILLIGPLVPPLHGQSLAFTRFVESIDKDKKIVVNSNLEGESKVYKVFGTFKIFFMITAKIIFYKNEVIYFTCSRSFFGSINDLVLINFARLKKVKIINHLHGSDFDEFIHSSPDWFKKILLYSYNEVDTSIVLLDKMKDQFKKFPNMKVEVVPNFYDKEFDEKLIEKDQDSIHLVYFSNIMSSKGIFELLEAFEKLSRQYKNIYLNIAGGYLADEFMSKNEVKEKFESKISRNNRIKFIGKTFGEEKVKLLQSSDIFVLPSYFKSEASPISIIEAMVSGNAIVTTNYKYLPDIVNNQNGILVEPRCIDSLVEGIRCLIINKDRLKKAQEHNKKEAKEKYSLDNYIDTLKQIVSKKSINLRK
tara:strand:- start:1621 stop:2712 length:1092 start_codon:yes stop_codon:yes gene_type:complete